MTLLRSPWQALSQKALSSQPRASLIPSTVRGNRGCGKLFRLNLDFFNYKAGFVMLRRINKPQESRRLRCHPPGMWDTGVARSLRHLY